MCNTDVFPIQRVEWHFTASPAELIVRWAKDFYEFMEGDMVTEVELVTDSVIEVDHVSISGLPLQIHDGHVTRISPLVLPGPFNPGNAF